MLGDGHRTRYNGVSVNLLYYGDNLDVLREHVKPRRREDVKPALRELLAEGRIVYWNGFYFLRGRDPY